MRVSEFVPDWNASELGKAGETAVARPRLPWAMPLECQLAPTIIRDDVYDLRLRGAAGPGEPGQHGALPAVRQALGGLGRWTA